MLDERLDHLAHVVGLALAEIRGLVAVELRGQPGGIDERDQRVEGLGADG